jgi:DNA-binding beta-propeller fold protein YncE
MAAVALPVQAGEAAHSRVIVSATLNSTLQFFDAATLAQTQAPLVARGLGPVRLVVAADGLGPVLYSANHGAATGSVGMYDLSADVVSEEPLSPVPARAGSVGIDVADVTLDDEQISTAVFVTNTTFALGGCDMPAGSVTAFERYLIATPTLTESGFLRAMREAGTVELTGSIPYGVAIAPGIARAFASTNCGDTLDTIALTSNGPFTTTDPTFSVANEGFRSTGLGPDAVLWDDARALVYVADIGGDSVTVFDAGPAAARTRVALPGSGPIDAALADTPAGRSWLITSNGQDDSISVIDRDALASCAAVAAISCDAEVARIPTGVAGGAPEGVAYDPATDRVFVVNKYPLGTPSLTAIQLNADGSGAPAGTIPLPGLGEGTPVPALIAFDVVVQTR